MSISSHAIEGRQIESAGVRSADAFQQLSPRSQVRQKPGMWVGSTLPEANVVYSYDGESIKRKEIVDFIDAIERFLLEILCNAVDNCTYSIQCGRKPDEIHVTLDEKTITISNGGCNVPVERMASNGEWIPSVLWGSLFSSSHYEEAKKKYKQSSGSSGTNGVGAALVNIFSERFTVKVEDPLSKRRYTNSWSYGRPLVDEQGNEIPAVVVKDTKIKETLITVSWLLDFPFFKISSYSTSMIELMSFHILTASFTAKVPVTLNGKRFDLRLLRNYAELFSDLPISSGVQCLEYYSLSSTSSSVNRASYSHTVVKHLEIPQIELILVDDYSNGGGADDKATTKGKRFLGSNVHQIAFANGIMNKHGGCHVDQMIQTFFGEILNDLNITVKQGKKFISFILSVRVLDPAFKGQNKDILLSPKSEFPNVTPAMLKDLKQWNVTKKFEKFTEIDKLLALKKTDGKKLRHLSGVTDLDDANFAGTSKSHLCTLIIVEGQSASTYPENLRNFIKDGRDTHGIFRLHGKPINVLNHEESLAENLVYGYIKQALALQEGVDYSIPANFKKLRYGGVLLAADADCDGWHIVGLLLLMFFMRFTKLVERGFVNFLRTPVLRVRGISGCTFYTKQAFEEWKRRIIAEGKSTSKTIAQRTKYYKGLGSSSAADVKEDHSSGKSVLSIVDRDFKAQEALELAFVGTRTHDRKEWLSHGVEGEFLDTEDTTQDIARFVHTGLKLYSLDNILRAIPSVMDGLKESMRKALVTAIVKFGLAAGNRKAEKKRGRTSASSSATVFPESKVYQIVGVATEKYCYHHGEPILAEVISNMCKDFVGTNNVTWFEPVSCFGTIDSGTSPNPRYASLGPAWWWSYVYSNLDTDLVKHVFDEEKKCEPEYLLPVVCWALCNQTDGVGTGYSTKIPGHNVEEIALAHLSLLKGRIDFPKLVPWWRGFRGNISLITRSKARKLIQVDKVVNIADVDESIILTPDDQQQQPLVCVIEGTYAVSGNKVIVTSLPLRTLEEFRKILVQLISEKVVQDFRNATLDEDIRFEIEMAVDKDTGQPPSGNLMKLLRLRKVISLSNLVLLNEHKLPQRFKSADDILIYFHHRRLKYYEDRKIALIKYLTDIVVKLDQKRRLIQAFLRKEILYTDRSKAEIVEDIKSKLPDVPVAIYSELHIHNLNADEVSELEAEIVQAKAHVAEVEATSKEEMWRKEILEFIKEYRAIYGSCLSDPYKALEASLSV